MISKKEFESAAIELFEKTRKFSCVKNKFEKIKDEKESVMSSYFDDLGIDELEFSNNDVPNCSVASSISLRVKRVQKIKILFNPEMVESKIGKSAITKTYKINDINGLIKYLKSKDVDPKIFKKFLLVEKEVNTEIIDKMIDLGEIKSEDLKGCYSVKKSKPYFKVTEKSVGINDVEAES